jgi:hypothetical protein
MEPGKRRVHAVLGIAHRHGSRGVAVIGAAEGEEAGAAAGAAIEPVLQRHFQCHLDGDRTGVAEKHPVEIAWRQQANQPLRQGQRLLVHQAAEHDVGHRLELALDRGADMRMVIAVAGGPPRGDAVDQFAAVGKPDAAALGRGDRKRRRYRFHLRIGQPDMVEAVPGRRRGGFLLIFAGITRHSALSCHRNALAR